MCRIGMADPGAYLPHASHGRAEVIPHTCWHVNPEMSRIPHRSPGVGRSNEPLGRHATDVQTVSAHQVPFDERDLSAETGRHHRRHQPGGSGSDHDDVVALVRLRVLPIGGMNVLLQLAVVLVVREQT